jgi:hypothetical protein
MSHVIILAVAGLTVLAAPVPQETKALVEELSNKSGKVRDEAVAALKGRSDAAPWLRRAVHSCDRDTAARAAALLATHARKRQEIAKQAVDSCIRNGQADLFVEWHHFWQPESKNELWTVGPRAGHAGLQEFAKRYPPGKLTPLEAAIGEMYAFPPENFRAIDGSFAGQAGEGPFQIRTDRLDSSSERIVFASVAGPIMKTWYQPGYYFALGEVSAKTIGYVCLVADGGLIGVSEADNVVRGPHHISGFIACRGHAVIPRAEVINAVLLVDGDIDLSQSGWIENSTIRASGEIRLKPGYKPVNCTIASRVKNPTDPYRFFSLADVGVSLVDDEEGLVVESVIADTPFGNCGLAKGDIICAIDDIRAEHSAIFRKQVRKAMVVHGDCLLTVARGNRTLDFSVYFSVPK